MTTPDEETDVERAERLFAERVAEVRRNHPDVPVEEIRIGVVSQMIGKHHDAEVRAGKVGPYLTTEEFFAFHFKDWGR